MPLFDIDALPLLAAARMSPQRLMMIGAIVTVIVSVFTFANWRFGVKMAFVMVLFEGAIRKWVFPQAQELAYFIKDIFLIGAYLRFYFFPDPVVRSWKVRAPVGLIVVCCVLISFSSLNPNIGSPILALYGLKVYLAYVPLALMVPYLFKSREQMTNNLFWYAILATPICLLGAAQFAAPGYSALNVYATGDEGATMGWADARVRITGTFSYLSGHTTFVIVFFALHLALLMNKLPKWKWVMLMANLPLLAANALMGGSRASVVALALIGAGFMAISAFQRVGTGSSAIIVVGGALVLAMAIVSHFFGEAKEQFTMRVRSGTDTFYERVVGMQVRSLSHGLTEGGLFGLGIGMTHPAVERLRNVLGVPRPRHMAPTFDSEVGQVMVEIGLMGWAAWYVMRLVMLVHSFGSFFSCQPGPLRSLIFASALMQGFHLLLSVVLNHTANFFVFAFYGLALIPTLYPAVTRKAATPPQAAMLDQGRRPAPGHRGMR